MITGHGARGQAQDRPTSDVWTREGEGLALLFDEDLEEASGLVAMIESQRPWPDVLGEELEGDGFRELLDLVERERADGPVYPTKRDVFAAFHLTHFDDVRVVILGQDPYHQPGQAHGLCFSVPRDLRPLPPSMRSIHAALDHDGFTPPDHGDLTGWATQGVLLLNTALTVRESAANSHARQWRGFTDAVISRLSARERPILFVLWGRPAQRKRRLVVEDRHAVVTAPHPAARGRHRAAFREAGTFREVNRLLESWGEAPIAWSDL